MAIYINEGFLNRFNKSKKDLDSNIKDKINAECNKFAKTLQSKYGNKLNKIEPEDSFSKIEINYFPKYKYFRIVFSEISQESYFELGNKFWDDAAKQLKSNLSSIVKLGEYKVADDIALINYSYEIPMTEAVTINYSKIKYDETDKEIFDKCVNKLKKRINNVQSDIIDQLFSMIEDNLDEDDPVFKQYNSKAKIKSKIKVESVQFERTYNDTYEGEFSVFLDLGSDIFGDHYIIAYISICKDGKETIFHTDYKVNVELEG